MSETRVYLGDGLSVSADPRVEGAVILTREGEFGEIYLDVPVLEGLDRYRAALKVAHEDVPDMMNALKTPQKGTESP